jgi:Na+-translocating ferredoxin:NAD+ oxidoreductase RnfD subunit
MFAYLFTASLCSFGIALVNQVEWASMGEYMLTTIATGGLMFASVFMITDPVTSPKSQDGKIIYATLAGFLAIFIRVFSSYPEGVMFSIALANMITPIIDSSIKGNTFEHLFKRTIKIASVVVICFGLTCAYAALENKNNESTAQLYQVDSNLDIGGVTNE